MFKLLKEVEIKTKFVKKNVTIFPLNWFVDLDHLKYV